MVLTDRYFLFSDKAMQKLISLLIPERPVCGIWSARIGEICAARQPEEYLEEATETDPHVTEASLESYLGKEKFIRQMSNEEDEVGIVRGLAWTSVGGDTLQIEVNVMPGKGKLLLTGQLGDVMKESAMAGISLHPFGQSGSTALTDDYFQGNMTSISIFRKEQFPRTVPSAGITMATAMTLCRHEDCRYVADVAMTGEITLRGRVLPIGGLKEKLLAAKNGQVSDLVLVPEIRTGRMWRRSLAGDHQRYWRSAYVSQMDQVLKAALVKEFGELIMIIKNVTSGNGLRYYKPTSGKTSVWRWPLPENPM